MYDFLVDKTVDITAREYHAAVYGGTSSFDIGTLLRTDLLELLPEFVWGVFLVYLDFYNEAVRGRTDVGLALRVSCVSSRPISRHSARQSLRS